MISKDPGIMGQLPCLYLKCTSMIMNTMNFSIDYSAPFIPNLLKSSGNNSVTKRTSQLNSPSQQKFSKSGYQVSQTDYDSNNKIIPQALNKPTNVRMSLQYLGTGISVTNEVIKPKDELSMFQQVCGGESICVFKGYVSPGDTFQIISRRHYGYPFSASIYINGLIAARISWCCEYRNHVGFQQGRRGCFRITQLSGGKPCNRCAEFNSQKKYQIKPGGECSVARTCERSVTSQEKEKTMGTMELMTWSTQSLYTAPSNKQPATPEVHEPPARRRRRVKKKTTPKEESDSEQENKLYNKYQRPRKPHLRDSRKCGNVSSLGQHKDKEAEHSGKSAVNDGNAELAATQRPGETRGYSEGQEDQYSTPSGTASSAQKHCTDSVRLHAEQHDGSE
ncbi:uncharacterized protein LOC142101728 [Mixophyes fleayi]|uniref:uncharacterized protein LOC142101728 n=1 Tax=Mixophyes fleayi TaxID=3061075 RepID=UPI003F4DA860